MRIKFLTLALCLATLSAVARTGDIPLPPTDVQAVLSENGKTIRVTWTAPGEIGENGGQVDFDNITYFLFDAYAGIYAPAVGQSDSCSFVYKLIKHNYPEGRTQDVIAFEVTAGYEEDNAFSLSAVSNSVHFGKPYPLPFKESFAGGKSAENIWGVNLYGQYGTTYKPSRTGTLKPQDGDNGFLTFTTTEPNILFGLSSGLMETSANPVLEFWYQGKSSTLIAMASDGHGNWETLDEIDLAANPTDGWTLYSHSLSQYSGEEFMNIQIAVLSQQPETLAIDNITVRDMPTDAIEDIEAIAPADDVETAPRYFSLQGIPLSQPVSGQPCIRIANGRATKFIPR